MLAWPLAALAAIAALKSDTSMPPPLPRVVFLGQGSATQDGGFRRLQAELRARHPDLASAVQFTFVSAAPGDAALADALRVIRQDRPALLFTANGHFARAARRHAPDVPLVFGTFADPVYEGVVSSMQRRPEAATGVWISNDLDAKRLEILRDAYPGIRRVGAIGDAGWIRAARATTVLADTARQLGIEVTVLQAESPSETLAHLQHRGSAGIDAWYLPLTGASLGDIRPLLSTLADQHKPVILGDTSAVRAGAPMSYAVDVSFAWPALADLTSRILQGEYPGDIPIERPPKFVLALRTGPETGLPPPHIAIVRRADLVIR